jgi:hypothetical protein
MSYPADSARPADVAPLGTEADGEPYAWEGDDDHVIFWMLSLTPTQRLAALQGFVDSFMALQNDRPSTRCQASIPVL